jgi:hypothetical protein
MTPDTERAARKKQELVDAATRALTRSKSARALRANSTLLRKHAARLVDTYVSISAPESRGRDIGINLFATVTMFQGGAATGDSTKAGNVRFNLKKLFLAISKGALAGVAVSKTPWLFPFAALILWDEFWSCAKIPLTESEACVLYAMWMHRDRKDCIANADVEPKTNLERSKRKQPRLNATSIRRCLDRLSHIGTIERSHNSPDMWWLREWVSVSYH